MAVNTIAGAALKAYGASIKSQTATQAGEAKAFRKLPGQEDAPGGFAEAIKDSLSKVNELQTQKTSMIESFAAGENQNVHELMITLQKAGMAMNLTSAVRNKIMTAYQEIMRMPM